MSRQEEIERLCDGSDLLKMRSIGDTAILVDEVLVRGEARGVLEHGPERGRAPLEDLRALAEHGLLDELAGPARRRELRFDLFQARHGV